MSNFHGAAAAIDEGAVALLRDERGVRVEDYLTALAAATGEAALVDCGLFDIETTDLTPGAAVFGDQINDLLTGDATAVDDAPATSVVGVLRDRLVPGTLTSAAFGSLERLYVLVASNVGTVPWGEVALTVPDDHRPSVPPLRLAFELRPAVETATADLAERRVACAIALAGGIERTREAVDVGVALTLSLEVAFGMAKTVPMSRRAFEETAGGNAQEPA